MEKLVLTGNQQKAPEVEHRSLLQEAFHTGASLAFGDKSKITDALTTYAPEALYTGTLFFPGGKAVVAAAAIGALNEVRTDESLKDGAVDAVLGSVKGAGTKLVFDKIGGFEFSKTLLNAPIKGVVMGSAATAINSALTRSTYDQNGKFDLRTGLERTAQSVLSPKALAIDAATFGLASSASFGINRLTGGLLARSPGLNVMLTGGTFGIASGGINELAKQSESGNGFDIGKIASQAAIHGAIDGLAAGPAAFKVGFAPRPIPDVARISPNATRTSPDSTRTSQNATSTDVLGLTLRSPTNETVSSPMSVRELKDLGGSANLGAKEFGNSGSALETSANTPTRFVTAMSDHGSVQIDLPRGHETAQELAPSRLIARDSDGKRISITKEPDDGSGIAGWTIRSKNGSSFSVHADVAVTRDGKISVSGRQIDMASHNVDDLVSLFVTKPDITPGIKAQIEKMEKILAPLTDPNASLDARNRALSDINDFARNHRSAALEAEINAWTRHQPPDIQSTLSRYYDDPINTAVRQSSYLRDTAFQMMRDGQLEPSVIQDVTKFYDRIEQSTNLSAEQKKTTVKNVMELLDDGNDPRMDPTARVKVAPGMYRTAAIQAAMHAANPDTITQYAHPTCALASLEVSAYTRAPDDATRLVAEVLKTGKFTATDGTVIPIDPFSLRPEFGSTQIDHVSHNQYSVNGDQYRSYASQVFQTTAANVYWQTRTVNPDGRAVPRGSLRYELKYDSGAHQDSTPVGYIVDYSGPKAQKWESDGYMPEQISEISNLISKKLKHSFVPDEALESIDRFKNWLETQPRDKMPVSIAVDARFLNVDALGSEPNILGHAINIHAAFDPTAPGGPHRSTAAIKNPWNGRMEFMSVARLFEMTYFRPDFTGPEGQLSQTVVPVSRADFEKVKRK